MDWVDKPQNYKDLYGTLQLLRGSHLNNFLLKTLKLGWVAFHSVTFQLKFLDFQSNQYKKLVPVLSRFCNGLYLHCFRVVNPFNFEEYRGRNRHNVESFLRRCTIFRLAKPAFFMIRYSVNFTLDVSCVAYYRKYVKLFDSVN